MREASKGLWDNIHKRRNQYGFTLVEMVVAMTIMVIIASVSTFGLIKWQEWTDFKRQNEYAQTLFISAQNQLSEYENTQRIERFVASLQNTDGTLRRLLDVKKLTDGAGKVYEDDSAVWYESNGIASMMEASKYQGELCYASCKLGDYEAYQQNGADALSAEAKQRGADVVFALLEGYVYDKNILNASISVEFSPAEGQVFAVCYSDHGREFVYGAPDLVAPDGQVNIANRQEDYRKEYMVGYYGTDTLARATQDASVKPKLADVRLNNEETLNLSFRVAKPMGISQSLVYGIQIYDGDTDRLVLSFDIQGSKLRGYADRRTISTPVTAYSYGTMGTATPISIGNYDIMAWIESDTTIRVVLDAADIEATANQYLADAAKLGKAGSDSEKFAGTYSFHRFGLSAENIYCTLQASGSIYRNSAKKQTQTKAVYFATARLPRTGAAEQTFTYTLENARHLYNVRYAEDFSMADTAALSDKIDATRPWNYEFVVSNTIDWNAFTQGGNFYKSDGFILTIPPNAIVNDLSGEDGRKAIDTVLQADFPSIRQLRHGDSFSGSSNITSVEKSAKGQIQNLGISAESNIYYDLYEIRDSRVEDAFVGLFIQNNGTIANLALDRITVTGMDRVGAFCGENRGHLLGLTVKNTGMESVISGQTNVGGIMGYQASVNDGVLTEDGVAASPVLKALVNRARISGREYVGGIVGQIIIPADSDRPQVTLTECENYGALEAVNSEEVAGGGNQVRKQTEPRYIGGIVGYCDNRYVNAAGQRDASRLKVISCISSPQYTREDLSNYLEMNDGNASDNIGDVPDEGYAGRNLKGVYVGGIVGYNNYALIEDCSTQAEKNTTGYVFGYQYVGGIVGFNQGPASGIQGGNSDKIGINQANVIGCQYVGGITGCNSNVLYQANGQDAALDANDVILPDKETNYNVRVDNWLNEGIVFARDGYAGGITGYNAGWIYNCNSRVRSSGDMGFFAEAYSGDYVGGIAGYNNGIVGNTDRIVSADGRTSTVREGADTTRNIATICYISGDSYVGGIVGYNDVDAIVENYQVVGGHILGNKNSGMYVGGFAGFNASVKMLMDEDGKARNITADPNEVTGRYFVGGTIGGNILNTRPVAFMGDGSGTPGELTALFETDNFLGEMSGTAFVGGFVGYNAFVDDVRADAAVILEKAITREFKESDEKNENLLEKVRILDNIVTTQGMAPSGCQMTIRGDGDDAETQNTLGVITARIYVSGVLGYNDASTALYVKNVKNTTPIIATEAIANAAEQQGRTTDYAGREMEYRYSYAGGIIGRVGPNVVIDHCRNTSSGTVTTEGTYTGGLCEVNEGRIINCDVSTIGSTVTDYIGGLCGLNKQNGIISGCNFTGKTITARNVAGGIAAENLGQISEVTIDNARVSVTGRSVTDGDIQEIDGVAATIAGYNGKTGVIILTNDIGIININSSGRYVGGVVGFNEGVIWNRKADKTASKLTISAEGNIIGRENVGGFIGYNASTDKTAVVEYFANGATVTGLCGNAGGIIGNNASGNIIEYCENRGIITASNEGNAGGITAENASVIRYCVDYARASAPSGMCGGITAINHEEAQIKECVVQSPVAGTRLVFDSLNTVGGISAKNAGNIENCKLNQVAVENYSTSGESDIGIVTGINEKTGTIIFGAASDAIWDSIAETYSDYSKVGGVAGTNYGRITGSLLDSRQLPTTVINATVRFKANAGKIASFGGVAGLNQGTIENLSVQGSIGHDEAKTEERLLGSGTTGYGGIVGFNGYKMGSVIGSSAVIRNCTFDGTVWAHGSGAAIANIGGIAGANNYGGLISSCAIGVLTDAQKETRIFSGDIPAEREYANATYTYDIENVVMVRNGSYIYRTSMDSVSYSYTGGMSGVNYGEILSCDNAAVSTATVSIESLAGFTGGITGINHEGARITGIKNKHLTTGKNWKVIAYVSVNDIGTGGIIANNYSGKNMAYVDNYAQVKNQFYSNTNVGGMIGAQLQSESTSFTMSNCRNYGDVTSSLRAGGLICLDMFQGVTFLDCVNYGQIYSIDSTSSNAYVAGILATQMATYSDMVLKNCQNHGNIIHGYGGLPRMAGLLAVSTEARGEIFIEDCVNTGLIRQYSSDYGTELVNENEKVDWDYAAGIVSHNGKVYINNCRNYNGVLKMSDMGIESPGNGDSCITNCLDVSGNAGTGGADSLAPLAKTASKSLSRVNYYISRTNQGSYEPAGDEMKDGAYFGLTTAMPFKNVRQGNRMTDYFGPLNASTQYFVATSDGPQKLHLDVAYIGDSGMDAFVFYMGGWNRCCSYTATVTDKYGNSATVERSNFVTWTDNMDEARQEINVADMVKKGELSSSQVVAIDIDVTFCRTANQTQNVTMNLYGFTWIPEGESEEIECDSMQEYIYAKYKTNFRLSQTIAQKNINQEIVDGAEFNFADYTYFDQSQDSLAKNRLVVHQEEANQWQEYEFEVEYADDATGIEEFLFYLTTQDGCANGTKDDYDYYYELKYQDGTTRTFGSEDAPTSLKKVPYKTEIRLSVEDRERQLQAIVVHLRCATSYRRYINMLGFKWIPVGGTDLVLLCNYKESIVPQERLNELVVVETSDGYELHPAGVQVADAKITMSGNAPIGQYDWEKIFYTTVSRYDARYDEEAAVIEDPRVMLYKELDPKFLDFVYRYNYIIDEKMADPTGLYVAPDGNGIYNFTWTRQEEPYEYEVYYTLSDSDGDVKYISEHSTVTQAYCKKKFDADQMQQAWQATGEDGTYVATFHVRAVSAYHKLHEGESDADKYDSAFVSISQNEKKLLPRPQFHIEEIEGNQKIIVIDNFDEFEDYKTVCTIYVDINGTKYPIQMDCGYSAPFSDADKGITARSDYVEYAYAKADDNNAYINSAHTIYRGTLMGNAEYPATGANQYGANFGRYQIGTTFKGFYGQAPDALSYQITYGANMRDFNTTAELVAQDDNLGVPVAYASGTVQTANRATYSTVYVSTTLTGFAGDIIGKDIVVRTYPYCSQNKLCFYGHEVADDVILRSREDVLAIQDENYFTKEGERITQSICVENEDGTLTLKPGYTIRDNQDAAGTYDVYFSASLAQYVDEDTPFQVASISYKYAGNGADGEGLTDEDGYHYYEVSSVPTAAWDNQRMQPVPVIEKAGYPIIKEKDNHATYTFEWDKDKTGALYTDARYMLELFGRTRDGKLVSLKTVSSTNETQYTFVDEQDNWNYKELVLQVSRIGTTDGNNKTVILPRTARETYAVKVKLTAVAKPGVMLAIDKDTQHFDKNNLRYEVTWGSLTDSDELAELGGYLITAYTLEPKKTAGDLDVIAHKVCFYAPELTTLEAWQDAHAQGISIENEDILDSEEVSGGDYTTSGENKTAIIDLSSFATGDIVYIRVQAIARPDAVLFANADASDPAELEIQERLATPFVKGDGCRFTVTPVYDGNGAMSITELNENGMQFTLTNPNYTSADNGRYEIAIAVYDGEGKALQDADLVAGENSVERIKKGSAWSDGAVEVLAEKSSSSGTTMDGDSLDEATYTLKLTGNKKLADYAGMWLKIAFRATTDNKISSFWTDEDPADANSVNYQWVRIPRAQLDAPDMNIGTVTGEYHIAETENEYKITRYTVSFAETDYAQGYSVMLTGADSAKPVTWLYLQKNEDGGYEVFYASTEYVMDAAKIEGGSFADPYADLAVAQGLKDGDTIELKMYQTDYLIESGNIITLVASLTLKDGVFTMELPDVAALTDANGMAVEGANDSWSVTAGVSVQAQMKDKSDYRYCDSKRIGSVFRNNVPTQPEVMQETEAPTIDVSIFTVTDDEDGSGYRIEVNPPQNLAIQVLTADENDSVVAVEYVSIGQNAGQQKRTFRLKKGMRYYVKFAEVTDDKGVGAWSQGYVLTIESGRVVLSPMTREPDAYTRTLDESRAGISITRKTPVATPGNATPGNAIPANVIPANAIPGNATPANATPGNSQS